MIKPEFYGDFCELPHWMYTIKSGYCAWFCDGWMVSQHNAIAKEKLKTDIVLIFHFYKGLCLETQLSAHILFSVPVSSSSLGVM